MSGTKPTKTRRGNDPWRTIARLAAPYRFKLFVVAVLAVLSTGADLIEPLIYRVAVNDVAGLFVQKAQQEASAERNNAAESALPSAAPDRTRTETRRLSDRRRATREPHRRGHVAPRTPSQTMATLLWAVALLFVINVLGYLFWLMSDNLAAGLASRIERSFIYNVFGHVLRLPLGFFGHHASGALAKRIDQLDQVSPIVNAVTQRIAPEVVSVVGILIIMLTQNWQLTLIAIATLPPYLWIARRSAIKLERGLNKYYELWEEVSAQIQDALAAIKTVKLSGAERRESRDSKRLRTRLIKRMLRAIEWLIATSSGKVF